MAFPCPKPSAVSPQRAIADLGALRVRRIGLQRLHVLRPWDLQSLTTLAMKIHQIRNASLVIESGSHRILLDPMLGNPGTLPPYSLVRFRARKNRRAGILQRG